MNYLLKFNKTVVTYSLLILIAIPLFGFKFLVSFLGNILLLIILIPLLLLLLVFIGFNSLESKVNTCKKCGTISFGFNSNCMNCGADLKSDILKNQIDQKASESTIEVKAEEIK